MQKLNPTIDAETFAQSADTQKRLIQTPGTDAGAMTSKRWQELVRQLVDLKVIDKPIDTRAIFFELPEK